MLPFCRLAKDGERGMEWPKSRKSQEYYYLLVSGRIEKASQTDKAKKKRAVRYGFFVRETPEERAERNRKNGKQTTAIHGRKYIPSENERRAKENGTYVQRVLSMNPATIKRRASREKNRLSNLLGK